MIVVSYSLVVTFRQEEDKYDQMQRQTQRDISDLSFLKETLSRQNETLQSDLSARRVEIDGLKSSVAQLTSAQAGIRAELEATKVSNYRIDFSCYTNIFQILFTLDHFDYCILF